MKMRKKATIDFTEGPLLKKIIWFAVPAMLTMLLQIFYNTADLIVVGHFRGDEALAAVGSTTSLMAMVSSIFAGLATGSGVLTAQYIGAKDEGRVEKVIHTSVLLAAALGIFISISFITCTPVILRWINVPDSIFDQAAIYARIVYIGYPFSLIYSYASSILRAAGDTKNPLKFLTISGITNVILNVIMVAIFGMGVEGVAIATVASNVLSTVMILSFMNRQSNYLKFSFSKLGFDWHSTKHILNIGIPTGIQNSLYNFSNMMVQSNINVFGDMTVAGNTAGANIENYPYVAQNAVQQASMTAVAQNVGAKKYKNIKKITWLSLACAGAVTILGGAVILLFRSFFVGLYVQEPDAVQIAFLRLYIMVPTVVMCGIVEVLNIELRAMKRSFAVTVINIFGGVVVRLLWVLIVPKFIPKIEIVYLAFPVSLLVCMVIIVPLFIYYYKKLVKEEQLT